MYKVSCTEKKEIRESVHFFLMMVEDARMTSPRQVYEAWTGTKGSEKISFTAPEKTLSGRTWTVTKGVQESFLSASGKTLSCRTRVTQFYAACCAGKRLLRKQKGNISEPLSTKRKRVQRHQEQSSPHIHSH